MASGDSSTTTPVKVPSSAAGYTPATLDPDLRSQINALLIKEGHIQKIQDHLLHALNAHPANWPTAIQSHALSLLRSGDVTTFPALVRRVMDDVRHQTALHSSSSSLAAPTNGTTGTGTGAAIATAVSSVVVDTTTNGTNGTSKKNGDTKPDPDKALALPPAVVEDALRVTKESLDELCEIEGGT